MDLLRSAFGVAGGAPSGGGAPGAGGTASGAGGWTNAAQELRQKQINALLTNPTLQARELTRDALYEIPVHLPSATPLSLHVTLPPGFPEQPPVVSVKPSAVHPWIGAGARITGHEKLRAWNQHHSLARILVDVVQEFVARNPATVNPLVGAMAYSGAQGPAAYAGGQGATKPVQAFAGAGTRQESPGPPGPQVEMFGLEKMSLSELEELMRDDAAFEDFFMHLPQVQEQQRARSEFIAGNEALAKHNLSFEPALAQLRSELVQEQSNFKAEREQFDVNYRAFQDLMMRFEPDYLISRLRAAVTESEELSESLSQSFLGGKADVEDFIKNYRETRKVYHSRAARLERVVRDPKILATT
ncbi:hypothetical protein HDU96_004990 [Phlyctochytrium bullatum]|nr:hypothetical protein HDU96_004990 [Phlyctochytrium bullatum]